MNFKRTVGFATGNCSGNMVQDYLQFDNVRVYGDFLLVKQQYLGNLVFQGVMVLSNDPKYENIFYIAYKKSILSSNIFGFELGDVTISEPSYFYYNISK